MSPIIPMLYGACFLVLLVLAIRLMGRGFVAAGKRRKPTTGRVHPELLDDQGNITGEPLLTVRFSDSSETSAPASQDSPDRPEA